MRHIQSGLSGEITTQIGVSENKINILDILFHAYEDRTINESGTFFSSVTGTNQRRWTRKGVTHQNKQYFSGPLGRPLLSNPFFSTEKYGTAEDSVYGMGPGDTFMAPEQVKHLSHRVFSNFANRVAKNESKKDNQSLKWLIAGHSRGGMIARFLANHDAMTSTADDGTTVTLEKFDSHKKTRTLVVKKGKKKRVYQVEIDLLLFSATGGPGLKGMQGVVETSPNHLLDFLAAGDAGAYGRGMKPYNQRRTIGQGSHLFLHMPVRHSGVVKAYKQHIIHMEIEILLTYLYIKHIGHSVDVDKLKVPFRLSKPNRVELRDIKLDENTIFSQDNCAVKQVVMAISEKINSLKTDTHYQPPKRVIDIHAQTDRRFLVMRSQQYETAIEERLALAKSSDNLLKCLFEDDQSEETKAFTAFAQHCLAKTGLNDPQLKNPRHAEKFYRLKTAAILKDKSSTDRLFRIVELYHTRHPDRIMATKESILSFLEKQPLGKKVSPQYLLENFLEKSQPNIAKIYNMKVDRSREGLKKQGKSLANEVKIKSEEYQKTHHQIKSIEQKETVSYLSLFFQTMGAVFMGLCHTICPSPIPIQTTDTQQTQKPICAEKQELRQKKKRLQEEISELYNKMVFVRYHLEATSTVVHRLSTDEPPQINEATSVIFPI